MSACAKRLMASVSLPTSSFDPNSTNYSRLTRRAPGQLDLNDMPDFTLPKDATRVTFRFVHDREAREITIPCASCAASHTLDFNWDELTPVPAALLATEAWLAKAPAERSAPPAVNIASNDVARILGGFGRICVNKAPPRGGDAELSAKEIVLGDKRLKWMERTFGEAPDGKHSLWITMHGGGQGTEEENDRDWKGYYGRYEFPAGSINVAPRAPANTWDMWHVPWVDDLFDRLIADMVIQRGVDPNRVYLIGYSAGGDGVYQLAPRMADRFAAAGMCAGHPNSVPRKACETSPSFYTWVEKIRPTIAMKSSKPLARQWTHSRPPIRDPISIVSPSMPGCSTICRDAKPK